MISSVKIRCTLVDDKTERLFNALHATNRGLYPAIYNIISILLTMLVSSATSERSFCPMRRMKFYLRLTVGDERLSNLSLIAYTQTCASRLGHDSWGHFINLYK